ncbi:hypothetical protein OG548_03680 [Streptomyces sp. NBC_01356]|nr:hypothetical protein [Streptomyces sp. NBC_01356]
MADRAMTDRRTFPLAEEQARVALNGPTMGEFEFCTPSAKPEA